VFGLGLGLFRQALQNKKHDSFSTRPDEQNMTSHLPVVKQKILFIKKA